MKFLIGLLCFIFLMPFAALAQVKAGTIEGDERLDQSVVNLGGGKYFIYGYIRPEIWDATHSVLLSNTQTYEEAKKKGYEPRDFLDLKYYNLGNATLFATDSSHVYVVGGYSFSKDRTSKETLDTLLSIDPMIGSPAIVGHLKEARDSHGMVRLQGNEFLVFGGKTSNSILASAEILRMKKPAKDSTKFESELIQPMNRARVQFASAILMDGRVLVIGGLGLAQKKRANISHRMQVNDWQAPDISGMEALQAVEIFDPKSKKWSQAADTNRPRFGHSATLLNDGRVLVVGGMKDSGTQEIEEKAEIYDPKSNQWLEIDGPTLKRRRHTASRFKSGNVLIAGGSTSSATEVYNPADNTWRFGPSLIESRYSHSAIVDENDRILLVGGTIPGEKKPHGKPELVLDSSDKLSSPGKLWLGRANHTSTVLKSGEVLVVGGISANLLRHAELVDPKTLRSREVARPKFARFHHQAFLLPDGKVAVVGGGYDKTSLPTEVYDPAQNVWTSFPDFMVNKSTTEGDGISFPKPMIYQLQNGDLLFFKENSVRFESYIWNQQSAKPVLTGKLNTTREDFSVFDLPGNKIVVLGGREKGGLIALEDEEGYGAIGEYKDSSTMETYDPILKKWQLAPAPENLKMVIQLSDKTFLNFRADELKNKEIMTEISDTNMANWKPSGKLSSAQNLADIHVLPNGLVLASGKDWQSQPVDFFESGNAEWTQSNLKPRDIQAGTLNSVSTRQLLLIGGLAKKMTKSNEIRVIDVFKDPEKK